MATPSLLDLTTSQAVQQWLISQSTWSSTELQMVQDAITAFSVYVLRMTGRGPMDGSVPAASSLNSQVEVSEVYDGNGAARLQIRQWPCVSVQSLQVNTYTVPASTSPLVQGFVIDGSGKFIAIRGGYGNSSAGLLVNTFQSLWGWRGAGGFAGCGQPGFSEGIQNVQISYTGGFNGTPPDLEFAVRRTVAKNYKQRPFIGLKSETAPAGGGTTSYDWSILAEDMETIMYYRRRAVVP